MFKPLVTMLKVRLQPQTIKRFRVEIHCFKAKQHIFTTMTSTSSFKSFFRCVAFFPKDALYSSGLHSMVTRGESIMPHPISHMMKPPQHGPFCLEKACLLSLWPLEKLFICWNQSCSHKWKGEWSVGAHTRIYTPFKWRRKRMLSL